jgi:hypothetical protein
VSGYKKLLAVQPKKKEIFMTEKDHIEKLIEIVDFFHPRYDSQNQTYTFVGQLLGEYRKSTWPYCSSYIHQVISGKLQAGKPLILAVHRCYAEINKNR